MTRPLLIIGPFDSDPSNIGIGTSDKDISNNVDMFGGEDPAFGAVDSREVSAEDELELTFNKDIMSEEVSVNSETAGDEEVVTMEDNFNDNGLVSTGKDECEADITTAELAVLNESVKVVAVAVVVVVFGFVLRVIPVDGCDDIAPCTRTELFGWCTESVLAIGWVNTCVV